MLTSLGQRGDKGEWIPGMLQKGVLLLVMGLGREAFLSPQRWLSCSSLPWNVSFQDFPLCKIAPPENPAFKGLACGYLTAFWLLKIEAVWFYSTLQLLCILGDCLTWAFPEISRAGNWVSKNWIILPKFTQLWFFPPLCSFPIFFLFSFSFSMEDIFLRM